MRPRQAGDPDAVIQSPRHVGHLVVWQAENRFFALDDDVGPDAELVARVTQEMRASLTIESGPVERPGLRLRPGFGRQAVALASPQPWVMVVGETR